MPPFQDANNRCSKSVKPRQPKKPADKKVLKRKAFDDDIGKENIPPFPEVSRGEPKKRKTHPKPASATAVTRSIVAPPPPPPPVTTTTVPLPPPTTTIEPSATTTDINLLSHRLKKNMTKITMSMVDDLGQSSQVQDKHVYNKIFESFVIVYAQKTLSAVKSI